VVTTVPVPEQARRRRGEELQSALLEAAWADLIEVGFANLTMESVAARAHTGIAVLYRRWPNKDQLVLAAIEHYGRTHQVEISDTGSLRGDLLALLTSMSKARAGFIAVAASSAFAGLLANTGLTPGEAREVLLGERHVPLSRVIYQRARDRGELDPERVPAIVLAMPFDLVRHDLLMNLKPLKPARILSIVDEVFLPLVASYQNRKSDVIEASRS
jgi:AcrR family transcriptional regulator